MLVNKQPSEPLICMQISTFYDPIFTSNLTKCEKGKNLIYGGYNCAFVIFLQLSWMFAYFSLRLIASMMPQVPKQTSPVVSLHVNGNFDHSTIFYIKVTNFAK